MQITPELEKQLAEGLRLLRLCVFKTKITPAAANIAEQLQMRDNLKPKYVYSLNDRWVVKYFFAGKQRLCGMFACYEYDSAYRLADLLVRKFHGRRTHGKAAPLTEDSYRHQDAAAARSGADPDRRSRHL